MTDRTRGDTNAERQAAVILADMFCASVLAALQEKHPRAYLYVWERDALKWLKTWRKKNAATGINAWTSAYMRHGPPPWPRG